MVHQPAGVVPVHPVGGDHLQVRQPLQRPSAERRVGSDAFVLVEPDRGLGERVVEGVPDRADRGQHPVQQQRLAQVHRRILRPGIAVMDHRPDVCGMAFPYAGRGGLADRGFDEPGLLRRRALPAEDPVGERVDHERGVGEHATGQPDVGEVGDQQPSRRRCPEPALDQVRGPIRGRIGDGGADLLDPPHSLPAVSAHQPFHGALGHDDALPVQMGPHLHRPIQRLRRRAAVLVGLVVGRPGSR